LQVESVVETCAARHRRQIAAVLLLEEKIRIGELYRTNQNRIQMNIGLQ
jgi:hypothetical protein